MSDVLLGSCSFDDGWPSEQSRHGGRTGWVAVLDGTPEARVVDGEPGVLPEPSFAWRKVEACERCARRLGARR